LQLPSAYAGQDAHWGVRSQKAEHYILEGVTDALFLDPSKLPQSICRTKTNAVVTPRGVVYTLRSVLRGCCILNAHFTGVYILLGGCLLCLFFLQGCGRPRWMEQADVKHPPFICRQKKHLISSRFGACLALFFKREKTRSNLKK
jgi:hypothetical protein